MSKKNELKATPQAVSAALRRAGFSRQETRFLPGFRVAVDREHGGVMVSIHGRNGYADERGAVDPNLVAQYRTALEASGYTVTARTSPWPNFHVTLPAEVDA